MPGQDDAVVLESYVHASDEAVGDLKVTFDRLHITDQAGVRLTEGTAQFRWQSRRPCTTQRCARAGRHRPSPRRGPGSATPPFPRPCRQPTQAQRCDRTGGTRRVGNHFDFSKLK